MVIVEDIEHSMAHNTHAHIQTHTCIHAHRYTTRHAYFRGTDVTYTHVCIPTYLYVCTQAYMYAHICTHTHTHTHVHIWCSIHLCMHTHKCINRCIHYRMVNHYSATKSKETRSKILVLASTKDSGKR